MKKNFAQKALAASLLTLVFAGVPVAAHATDSSAAAASVTTMAAAKDGLGAGIDSGASMNQPSSNQPSSNQSSSNQSTVIDPKSSQSSTTRPEKNDGLGADIDDHVSASAPQAAHAAGTSV